MNATAIPERDFDLALARWVRQRSGSDLLARAAGAVSQAEAQGHVRCDLAADAGFSRDGNRGVACTGVGRQRRRVRAIRLRGRCEFVYAGATGFMKRGSRRSLRARAAARTFPLDARTLAADVNELFAGMDAQATRWQRAAVAAVPGARVFVLTGGPGTGKTTTVLRMLLMLLKHAQACGLPAHPAIALAAPTGKAAQRLSESVAREAGRLESTLAGDSAFMPLLQHVASTPAQTLHRLLGFNAHSDEYAFDADVPLPADIVIADEASMIDLAMMRRLFDALRPNAVLILLGDPAQLYAVEAGSVLGDIVGSVPENRVPQALAQRLSGALGTCAGSARCQRAAGRAGVDAGTQLPRRQGFASGARCAAPRRCRMGRTDSRCRRRRSGLETLRRRGATARKYSPHGSPLTKARSRD